MNLASYILMGIKLEFKDILKNSILYLGILTFIRMLPISFGIHIILGMFVLGIILYKIKKKDVILTILTISKMFACLAISEGIYVFIINTILGVPLENFIDNTSVESALLTLSSLFIFIALVIILRFLTNKIGRK